MNLSSSVSFFKRITMSSVALVTIAGSLFAGAGQAFAATSPYNGVKVQLNADLIEFPDAEPMIDDNQRLHVPLRFISESLGYAVDYKEVNNTFFVSVQSPDGLMSLELKTSDPTVVLNDERVSLDTAPFVKNGRVYVPLRFIAESFNQQVNWDDSNRVAIVSEVGQFFESAWKAPKMTMSSVTSARAITSESPKAKKVLDVVATAYSASAEENGKWGSVDYFGNPLALGTIAVDPKVIPFGTKVYIEGYDFDGLPAGGMTATASDAGGAIKGNRIDIFVPGSRKYVAKFGIQNVKVHILAEK